ncbi:MAG: tetraacyldisaccharide 4'-kinase [Legionellales bacterium]|nr:MAG: tetraacyldisaccharide 4'-kinase [Legionellales bacterium]
MTCCQKIKQHCHNIVSKLWHNPLPWYILILLPLSYIFHLLIIIRCYYYKKIQQHVAVPVIVVGNINVGGSGKTPVVIEIIQFLQGQGYNPGIISRGYTLQKLPRAEVCLVSDSSDPNIVGDEAVLLAEVTKVPVAVSANRVLAAKDLLAQYPNIDILVSDDGLQHYKLARDIEIAVVNPVIGHGNGKLLPLGPLREPISRLDTVDIVVAVNKEPIAVINIKDKTKQYSFVDFVRKYSSKKIHAVAAIGHPETFFDLLLTAGFDIIAHSYPDHYSYSKVDIKFADALEVLMTEKDAIKCTTFAGNNCWLVRVVAKLPDDFYVKLLKLLR